MTYTVTSYGAFYRREVDSWPEAVEVADLFARQGLTTAEIVSSAGVRWTKWPGGEPELQGRVSEGP